MRFTLALLILSIFSISNCAQKSTQDSLIAISVNETLWKPFKQSYEAKNANAFNALHTKDVMRVSPWGIKIGEEYFDSNTKHFSEKPERSQSIDFAMEHRVYDGDNGYEVGFYRIIYTIDDEVVHTSYARFHVRLRNVDGHWKIAQDWDIGHINNVDITNEDFEKARFLDLK